jgi:hypothetical protein
MLVAALRNRSSRILQANAVGCVRHATAPVQFLTVAWLAHVLSLGHHLLRYTRLLDMSQEKPSHHSLHCETG